VARRRRLALSRSCTRPIREAISCSAAAPAVKEGRRPACRRKTRGSQEKGACKGGRIELSCKQRHWAKHLRLSVLMGLRSGAG
jgi:hypothetical protein